MRAHIMITSVEINDYLSGWFRQNETLLTPEEKKSALTKGFIVKGVEGGSDTVYQYRLAVDKAPPDMADWAFRAAEVESVEASGRTWSSGTAGPLDADVTFTVASLKEVDIKVLRDDAKRRQAEGQMESEAYRRKRAGLTALEAQVKDRLSKAQAPTDAKTGK